MQWSRVRYCAFGRYPGRLAESSNACVRIALREVALQQEATPPSGLGGVNTISDADMGLKFLSREMQSLRNLSESGRGTVRKTRYRFTT